MYNYNNSYIDYVSNEQGMFYGVVQADLTRTTLLTAGANVNGLDGSNGAAYGLPAAHDGSDLRLPRELNLGADWADEKRLSQNFFVKLDQDLGAKWKFQAQVTEYLANADFLESSTYYSVDPKTGEGAGVWGAKEAWDTDSTGVDLYTSGLQDLRPGASVDGGRERLSELVVVCGLHRDRRRRGVDQRLQPRST